MSIKKSLHHEPLLANDRVTVTTGYRKTGN